MHINGQRQRENNNVLNPSGGPGSGAYKPERAGYGNNSLTGQDTGNLIYGSNVHQMDNNFKPSIKVNAGH